MLRHDGEPFDPETEAFRIDNAGKALQCKAVLIQIRGDWVEFAGQLGFPSFSSGSRPCFFCPAFGAEMHDFTSASVYNLGWHINTDDEYASSCTRCEIWVVVGTQAQHRALLTSLFSDTRQHGDKGRCLANDYKPLNLKKGDRLEPNNTMLNTDDFDALGVFPTRLILFRRTARESICTRRCPLFDTAESRIGITPSRTIVVDVLHSLFLGPILSYCKYCIWFIFDSGIWAAFSRNCSDVLTKSVLQCRSELFRFYQGRRRAGLYLTELPDLTIKMVGTSNAPSLKLKAMEAWGFLLFLLHVLRTSSHRFTDPTVVALWLECGECLERFTSLLRSTPARVPDEVIQQQLDLWARHTRLYCELGLTPLPKHHIMVHGIARQAETGNLWLHACFEDESINKLLKAACRLAHQTNLRAPLFAVDPRLFNAMTD